MSGRPIVSHWSTATQRLNVMMPTSASGISNERSKALPGRAVASTCRSFIQSSTVLPVMPRYSALSCFVPGGPLDLGHRVGAVALGYFGGPPVHTQLQVLLAPRHELGRQRLLREVGESQVGAVGPVVVGELGARVDVALVTDVEARLLVG